MRGWVVVLRVLFFCKKNPTETLGDHGVSQKNWKKPLGDQVISTKKTGIITVIKVINMYEVIMVYQGTSRCIKGYQRNWV